MKIKNKKAFTLIELLVVVAIMGLLLSVTMVNLSSTRIKTRDTIRGADIQQIYKIIEFYLDKNSFLPSGPTPPGQVYCYKSDNASDWATLANTLGFQLPSDMINANDYRYVFFRTNDAGKGCEASPNCGFLMFRKEKDGNVVLLPLYEGNYSNDEAVAFWSSACGGGTYPGFDLFWQL